MKIRLILFTVIVALIAIIFGYYRLGADNDANSANFIQPFKEIERRAKSTAKNIPPISDEIPSADPAVLFFDGFEPDIAFKEYPDSMESLDELTITVLKKSLKGK